MPHTKGDAVQLAMRGDLQGRGVREGNRKGHAFAAPSCGASSGLLQLPPILFHTPTALFPDLTRSHTAQTILATDTVHSSTVLTGMRPTPLTYFEPQRPPSRCQMWMLLLLLLHSELLWG